MFEEYCVADPFVAKCRADDVVVMQHVVYGRMRLGRCITTEFGGYIRCKTGKEHSIFILETDVGLVFSHFVK